jgi:RHS repeat-associated protein
MMVAGQPAITYTPDDANRLTMITQGTASVVLGYDAANRRTSLTLPDGIVVSYGYDSASRLTSIVYQKGGSVLGNLAYAYDQNDRRTQVSGSYARTGLPVAVGSASYNVANQLAQWGNTTLTYDNNGNLQSDGTSTYTWNPRNQLASITGGTSASFQYDAYGRRVGKTLGSTSTAFLYDSVNVVQELSGPTPTANLLSGGIDQIIARTDSNGMASFLADALGSGIALGDSTGAVQTSYTYEPFGNTTSSGVASTNSFQYTGRENDANALYFYRTRYYSPTLQRFISEDPIGFGGGINKYAYVGDDPINNSDPSGQVPVHGNWCGPNWTGGQTEPYNPLHDDIYLPPIDYTDKVCKNHDQCYDRCRQENPCDKSARRSCMRSCDQTLLADIPAGPAVPGNVPQTAQELDSNISGLFVEGGIAVNWLYPSAGPNGLAGRKGCQ